MNRNPKHRTPVLKLCSLVKWSRGKTGLSDTALNKTVGSVQNDSRKIKQGDVFLAIKTENDDGHKYIDNAFKAGAIAAIVNKKNSVECSAKYRKKLIFVSDTIKAVQKAAACFRKEMGILFIGITGSNGKTTTRSFVSAVLGEGLKVGETFGNWNNHIGVPLSILNFTGDEWVGVIEMGANHAKEIHDLSMIVRPDISIITNIGYGHIGLFGSLSRTTEAKFEIVDGLNRKNGFLLLNGDDQRIVKEATRHDVNKIFYGLSSKCDCRAVDIEIDAKKGIEFSVDDFRFQLPIPGRHFIYSVLPAIYLGKRCGIPNEIIADSIRSLKPAFMRGAVQTKNGVDFIVDCYNANPSSMKSAINYLVDVSKPSSRAAVVGDMLELGSSSKRLHKELGKMLARAQIRRLVTVGEWASEVAQAAINEGINKRNVSIADNAHKALEAVNEIIRQGDMVLLKGSRGIHLETVFENYKGKR
ncbi:MAG TPA: UDP-N-acetylmuramoyl-tripeptide--D-alanyl-D-alanine ligase [Chitinispirillaceae bacterium]|nr:UDP-N-acetylmuramoyl-tripeptide--D-alanyl-D-alanine ligase [Chitinispirillaceae bacterium]